jgi:hypothetical protein
MWGFKAFNSDDLRKASFTTLIQQYFGGIYE